MSGEIVNRVQKSGINTLDLSEHIDFTRIVEYDLKQNLFQELVLKEKDFRETIEVFDWSIYEGKDVVIICSVEAIIPTWAYMLLTLKVQSAARTVVIGSKEDMYLELTRKAIEQIDFNEYQDTRVVVKGCSELPIPTFAYGLLTQKLAPVVKSLMFGEPCSTVPLYKKKAK